MKTRRFVIDGLDVAIKSAPKCGAMLVMHGDEIIGRLQNRYGNRFAAVPSPMRGHQWAVYPSRDEALRALLQVHYAKENHEKA